MGEDEDENIDWDGVWRNLFCYAKKTIGDEVTGSAISLEEQGHALPYWKRD